MFCFWRSTIWLPFIHVVRCPWYPGYSLQMLKRFAELNLSRLWRLVLRYLYFDIPWRLRQNSLWCLPSTSPLNKQHRTRNTQWHTNKPPVPKLYPPNKNDTSLVIGRQGTSHPVVWTNQCWCITHSFSDLWKLLDFLIPVLRYHLDKFLNLMFVWNHTHNYTDTENERKASPYIWDAASRENRLIFLRVA